MQGRVTTRVSGIAATRRRLSVFGPNAAPTQLSIFAPSDKFAMVPGVAEAFTAEDNAIKAFESLGLRHQEETEKLTLFHTNMRKHHGVYYTPYRVAYQVISDTLALNPPTLSRTFLEPCAGHGVFVIAYIDYVIKRLALQDEASVQRLLDNIYCAEIDAKALRLLKACVEAYLHKKYGFNAVFRDQNLFVGNALYDCSETVVNKVDLRQIFEKPEGFDYVFTNPPYKLLKANADRYHGDESAAHRQELKRIIAFLKKGKHYPLSQGTLNLYKLFVEDIVTRYLKRAGGIGLLVPQTILNDKHSTELRKTIIEQYELTKIYVIPEQAAFFEGIAQAFCLFGFNDTNRQNKNFEVVINVRDESGFAQKGYITSAKKLLKISIFEPIIITDDTGYAVLRKIHTHPSIRENTQIYNLRGELDLTLNKQSITRIPTPHRLIRGAHVSLFDVALGDEYVVPEFLAASAKAKYAQLDRLVCQQISNMRSGRRLKFALVPQGVVLANSVNFISLAEGCSYSIKSLLAIMNSTLLNWRFKLTSSNNHINNYEIDDLPLPLAIGAEQRARLEACIDSIGTVSNQKIIETIDAITAEIYSLTPAELSYVVAEAR